MILLTLVLVRCEGRKLSTHFIIQTQTLKPEQPHQLN
jgi:hypothetical protein